MKLTVKQLSFFGFSLVLIFIMCRSTAKNENLPTNETNYKSIAEAKYKNNIEYVFNFSQNKVLCIHKTKSTPNFPQYRVQFFVFDLNENKTIYEDNLNGGSIKWFNDQQLEILLSPEVVTGDEPPGSFKYIYDLEKKKKIN